MPRKTAVVDSHKESSVRGGGRVCRGDHAATRPMRQLCRQLQGRMWCQGKGVQDGKWTVDLRWNGLIQMEDRSTVQ